MSLFGLFKSQAEIAEDWLREDCNEEHISALVRHYAIAEVTDEIERVTGVQIRDQETTKIVQKLRDEYGCGPIAEYNLPGYVDPDDYPEDQEASREYNAERAERDEEIEPKRRLLGWLF